jgi:transcriptional regulator with XRE-family HTH domain
MPDDDLDQRIRALPDRDASEDPAAYILRLRKSLKLTQAQLAHGTGVVQETIGRIERRDHPPGVESATKLSKFFRKPREWFLPADEALPPEPERASHVEPRLDPIDDVTRGSIEQVLRERAEEEDPEMIAWLRDELEQRTRFRGASKETVSSYANDLLRRRRRELRQSAGEVRPGEDGESTVRTRQSAPDGMIGVDRTGRKKP